MPNLSLEEKLMTEKELVYSWLCNGRISYEEITTAYVRKIEEELRKANYEATSYTYPLYLLSKNAKLSKKNEWNRDKAIGMLYAFNNLRNGINLKKEFESYVKEHNLNTKIENIQYEIYNTGLVEKVEE